MDSALLSDLLTLLGAFFLGFLAGVALGPARRLLRGFWHAPGRLTRSAANAGARLRQAFKIKPGDEGPDRTGLTGAIAGAVSDVLTLGVRRAEVAFREGNAAFDKGDYELARRRFAEALLWDRGRELRPMHSIAHSRLGWLDEERGDLDGAKDHYQKAIRVEPTDLMATVRLGMVHFRLGETGPAIFQFQRALELNPSNLDAHYYLYAIYRQAGMERESVEQLRLIKMGETPEVLAELFGGHGADNFRLSHYAEAIKDYELALQVAPNTLPLYVALGDLYYLQNQPSTALEIWSRGLWLEYSSALAERVASVATGVGETWPVVNLLRDAATRHPRDGRFAYLLSLLMRHLGEDEQSLDMLETAVRLSPGLTQAQLELGARYTTMGQSDKAFLTYREGLEAAWGEGIVFRCHDCGYISAESQERCFQCGRWGSVETMTRTEAGARGAAGRKLLQQAAGVRRSLDSLWHRIAGLLPAGSRQPPAEQEDRRNGV